MSNEELKLQDPRCRIQCPDILPENTGVAAQCISQDKMSNEALKLQDPRCRIRCPDILPENTGHINLLYL